MTGGPTVAQVEGLLAVPELLAATRPGDLATAARLRQHWDPDLVAAATAQADLRTRAAGKFDRADRMLFTRPGLEQATALGVARHAAERLVTAAQPGGSVVDLCCGIGGDAIALAASAGAQNRDVGRVIAVDRDPVHALLCRHNAAVYDADLSVAVADVTTSVGIRSNDTVHVDPARRDASGPGADGARGGYRPDLTWCTSLPAERVCVKVAPGIAVADRPAGWEAEWVSVRRDLKVALLWSPALAEGTTRATVIDGRGAVHTRIAAGERPPPPVAEPGEWVVDPDPAVTRAGLVADLAGELDGWLIDPRIGFVCTSIRAATVWGRVLRVAASLPFAERPVATELRRLGANDLQIRRRGLAGDVTTLAHRLLTRSGRESGPPRRVTLLLTRHLDRPWALLCTDPD